MTISQTFRSSKPPVECLAVIVGQADTLRYYKYAIVQQGVDGVRLENRYIPGWLIFFGILFFPLIVLWFFVRKTATVSLTFVPDGDGTRVLIAGEGRNGLHLYLLQLEPKPRGGPRE